MHRKQPDELVHALVHVAVELRERQQVLPYLSLLGRRLSQEPLRDNELHVAPGDEDLLEAILDSAQTCRDKGESRAVENGFLDSGDEAEAQIFADLAHFAEEVQIEDQFLIFPASQVVEQLVDNDEETVVGILSVEQRHHLFEAALVVCNSGCGWEGEADAQLREMLFDFRGEDVAEGHRHCADLGADHLELAGDPLRGLGHRHAPHQWQRSRIFRDG